MSRACGRGLRTTSGVSNCSRPSRTRSTRTKPSWSRYVIRCVSPEPTGRAALSAGLQDAAQVRAAAETLASVRARTATYRQAVHERAQVAELVPTIQANQYVCPVRPRPSACADGRAGRSRVNELIPVLEDQKVRLDEVEQAQASLQTAQQQLQQVRTTCRTCERALCCRLTRQRLAKALPSLRAACVPTDHVTVADVAAVRGTLLASAAICWSSQLSGPLCA
jgi:hypothetical protein